MFAYSIVSDSATRTVACQAPLSMGFPPLTPPGDLPVAPALQADS